MAKQKDFANGNITISFYWPDKATRSPLVVINSVRGLGRVEHCMNIERAEWYRNELDKAIRCAKRAKKKLI
jgi:hypothetical protein